jgi:hypothetical protein
LKTLPFIRFHTQSPLFLGKNKSLNCTCKKRGSLAISKLFAKCFFFRRPVHKDFATFVMLCKSCIQHCTTGIQKALSLIENKNHSNA